MAPYVPDVYEAVFRAIRRSGASALVAPSGTPEPVDFIAAEEHRTTRFRVYGWLLSQDGPGGQYELNTLAGERHAFDVSADTPTFAIGYDPEMDVFVGLDLSDFAKTRKHSGKVRFPWQLLARAQEHGVSFGVRIGKEFPHPMECRFRLEREVEEVLVAFTPEHFLHFVAAGAEWLHCRDVPAIEAMYMATTATAMSEAQIHSLPEERAKMARTIYVWVRDSRFSRRVLKAYNYQCAITGLQLELPVAAHILPVASGVKNDTVSNGIALSPTFHAALDDGLIYLAYDIDDRLHLKRNWSRTGYLLHRKWHGRAELVLEYADREIPPGNLPHSRDDWPDPKAIAEGNRWRGVLK